MHGSDVEGERCVVEPVCQRQSACIIVVVGRGGSVDDETPDDAITILCRMVRVVPSPRSAMQYCGGCEWSYHDVPCCVHLNLYVWLFPGGMGHSVTPLTPSCCALFNIRTPCQCIDVPLSFREFFTVISNVSPQSAIMVGPAVCH